MESSNKNGASHSPVSGPVAQPEVYDNLPDLPEEALQYLWGEIKRREQVGDEAGYNHLVETAFDLLNNRQLDQMGDE